MRLLVERRGRTVNSPKAAGTVVGRTNGKTVQTTTRRIRWCNLVWPRRAQVEEEATEEGVWARRGIMARVRVGTATGMMGGSDGLRRRGEAVTGHEMKGMDSDGITAMDGRGIVGMAGEGTEEIEVGVGAREGDAMMSAGETIGMGASVGTAASAMVGRMTGTGIGTGIGGDDQHYTVCRIVSFMTAMSPHADACREAILGTIAREHSTFW